MAKTPPHPATPSREERLAEQLRANLRKRKQQARDTENSADEPSVR